MSDRLPDAPPVLATTEPMPWPAAPVGVDPALCDVTEPHRALAAQAARRLLAALLGWGVAVALCVGTVLALLTAPFAAWHAPALALALLILGGLLRPVFHLRRSLPASWIDATAETRLRTFARRVAIECRVPPPARVLLAPDARVEVIVAPRPDALLGRGDRALVVGVAALHGSSLSVFKAQLAAAMARGAPRGIALDGWFQGAFATVHGALREARGAKPRGALRAALRAPGDLALDGISALLRWVGRAATALEAERARHGDRVAASAAGSAAAAEAVAHGLRAAARWRATREALRAEAVLSEDVYAHLDGVRAGSGDDLDGSARVAALRAMKVAAVDDAHPAWTLLRDPAATRRAMTASLDAADAPRAPIAHAERALARARSSPDLDPRWRGAWARRLPRVDDVDAALAAAAGMSVEALDGSAAVDFDDEIESVAAQWHRITDEITALDEAAAGEGLAADGTFAWRGGRAPASEARALRASLRDELRARDRSLFAADTRLLRRDLALALALGGDEALARARGWRRLRALAESSRELDALCAAADDGVADTLTLRRGIDAAALRARVATDALDDARAMDAPEATLPALARELRARAAQEARTALVALLGDHDALAARWRAAGRPAPRALSLAVPDDLRIEMEPAARQADPRDG